MAFSTAPDLALGLSHSTNQFMTMMFAISEIVMAFYVLITYSNSIVSFY